MDDITSIIAAIQYVREMRGHDRTDERMCMRPRLRGLQEGYTSAQDHLARIGNCMHGSSRLEGQQQPRVGAKGMFRRGRSGRGRGASLFSEVAVVSKRTSRPKVSFAGCGRKGAR